MMDDKVGLLCQSWGYSKILDGFWFLLLSIIKIDNLGAGCSYDPICGKFFHLSCYQFYYHSVKLSN